MDIYIKGALNLNLVHDPDALSHLQLAHQLFLNRNNLNYLTENTGIIFVSLVNGFDCLFHSTISSLFLNALLKKYPANSKIPQDIWKTLPLDVRELWKGNHMSMGHIDYLLDEILNPNPAPQKKTFKEALPSILPNKDLKILQKFAKLARKTRNPGSHGEKIDYNSFMKNIPIMIETLNKAFVVFNKITKNKSEII